MLHILVTLPRPSRLSHLDVLGPGVRDRKLSEVEESLISTLSGCADVLVPPQQQGLALPALCQRVLCCRQTPPAGTLFSRCSSFGAF